MLSQELVGSIERHNEAVLQGARLRAPTNALVELCAVAVFCLGATWFWSWEGELVVRALGGYLAGVSLWLAAQRVFLAAQQLYWLKRPERGEIERRLLI